MKKLGALLLVAALAVAGWMKGSALTGDDAENVKAAIVMDADTNQILYEENGQEPLPIASMSKLMTQYLVLDAIKAGDLDWHDVYQPGDEEIRKMAQPGMAALGLEKGHAYTVHELFTAMTVISANDAAIALAGMTASSEEGFVEAMNEKADELGLASARFINATGLDEERTNIASARDVAALAQKLLEHHPEVLEFTKMTDFTTEEGVRRWSTNAMLPGMPDAVSGMDGLKTGYTEKAGSCFASTGIYGGKRIITIVMGAGKDDGSSGPTRFDVTRELLDAYALRQ